MNIYSRNDLIKLRNCGERMTEIILKVASILRGDDELKRACPVYNKCIDENLCYETKRCICGGGKKKDLKELSEVRSIAEARRQCRNCVYRNTNKE